MEHGGGREQDAEPHGDLLLRMLGTPGIRTLAQANDRGQPGRDLVTADSDEVAQAFRFDGAQDSDLKPPMARSLAGW